MNSEWVLDDGSNNNEWVLDDEPQTSNGFMTKLASMLANHPQLSNLANKASIPAGKFNSLVESLGLPNIAGGILQGGADTAISALNLPLEKIANKKIPYPNFTQYLPQDLISKGEQFGGGLAGGSFVPGSIFKALGKVTPELSGYSRLISELMKGGLTGYVTGEQAPFGRSGGATLGTAGSALNFLNPSTIAKKIISDGNKIKRLYSIQYRNLFNKAKEIGADKISIPEEDYDFMRENVQPIYIDSLQKFLDDPSLENAHWAQSDLGKYVNKNKGKNLVSSQIKALKMAESLQSSLKNKIEDALSKDKKLNLNGIYSDLTEGYKKDVIPYRNNLIQKFKKKKLKSSSLINRLASNDEFNIDLGDKYYPELKLYKALQSNYGKGLMMAAGAGSGLYLLHYPYEQSET